MCAWLISSSTLQVLYSWLAETYVISMQAVVGDLSRKSYGHLDFGSDHSIYFHDNESGNWVGVAVCAFVWNSQSSV